MSDDVLEQALAYWNDIRGTRLMPSRRDIDPVEIPHLLRNLALVDVLADVPDFRYRLIGTEIRDRCHRDYTSVTFSSLPHQGPGNAIWMGLMRVVEDKKPIFGASTYVGPTEWVRESRDLWLPLSSDGANVDTILIAVSFHD